VASPPESAVAAPIWPRSVPICVASTPPCERAYCWTMSDAASASPLAALVPVSPTLEKVVPSEDAENPRADRIADSACVVADEKDAPPATRLRTSGTLMLVSKVTSTVEPLLTSASAWSVSGPTDWLVSSS
jgi:hypothetical protein